MRWFAGFFALLFMASAVVQVNDPDPWVWIAFYLVAAGVAGAWAWRRTAWWVPAVVAVVALLWTGTIVPAVMDQGITSAKQFGTEVARESGGLLIVAAVMAALALTPSGK